MGKASNRKAKWRIHGGGGQEGKKSSASTVEWINQQMAMAEFARATAMIHQAIREDNVDVLECACAIMAKLGKHYVADVTCDIDYGNGPHECSVVQAAYECEAKEVCNFLQGAMSCYPDSPLYKSMISAAVRGLDSTVTAGKFVICDSWARWEFDRVDPAAMSPAERSGYCSSFGPNASRLWWELAGKQVAESEARELDGEILAPADCRPRASAGFRL